MSKRVLYVATVVKTHIMHFHIPYLKMFKEWGWHTAVAARNDYEDPSKCNIPYCDEYIDIAFERSPLKLANIKAYRKLKKIIDEGNYDIVHCHTPVAAMLTRLAARKARKRGTKVYYTAHGFHFFKGAPLLNWLVYFPVEWLCSFMTDTLITINQEDFARAKKWMHAKRIDYVPGVGIDVDRYKNANCDKGTIRRNIGVPEDAVMLLSVGELNDNKNHQIIIRAIAQLENNNVHYVIAGIGPKAQKLQMLATELGLDDRVKLLGYRSDVPDLLAAADVYCFPSYREGLSLSVMEAMICGKPVVCSRIRGNVDLIDSKGGGFFEPDNAVACCAEIKRVLNNDIDLMGRHNKKKVLSYSLRSVLKKMKEVYQKELIEKDI